MSRDIAIKVENLGKLYRLGEVGTGTLSHDLKRWAAKVRGKEDPFSKIGETNDRTQKGDTNYVWALKDVDFEIQKGQAVGIIGRNGAGKSTLLKLLSKITKPSTGIIKVNGRVASLLEVGTGFHPEMTGRENIFLNGAIMGMTKGEIKGKFDEIVEFAGVGRYVDTPVKRYSSGMYVRLAFAVAAHLEPEILIVDEVLAVGDAEFQKKCIGKMKDVSAKDGRTVLFVSHDLGAVAQLCDQTMVLSKGTSEFMGVTDEAIVRYIQSSHSSSTYVANSPNILRHYIKSIVVTDKNNEMKSEFYYDEPIHFKFELSLTGDLANEKLFVIVLDSKKRRIFACESKTLSSTMELMIESHLLVRGRYSITAMIHLPKIEQINVAEDVCSFEVIDTGSELQIHGVYDYGVVFGRFQWM